MLLAFIYCFLIIAGLFAICYIVCDFIQFNRALWFVFCEDRLEEWFEQPNRTRIGSGFRLFKHFRP